jgi:3-carboxy-cis,cis-muconate cycloisomerase
MQAATMISVSDRLATWRAPLDHHQQRLKQIIPRIARVQIGGASGDRAGLAPEVLASMEASFGLPVGEKATHAMRDGVGEFASILALITGTLGKVGQDVCLMAQQGIEDIALSNTGGSSAMPHKQNPVIAELLVTLARFNATQVSGIQHAMIHEQERSGSAWGLEWMILPQMALATGRSLTAGTALIASVERIGAV